ncbi:MAG: sugar phosphate nucleotidyltransferase, partial [Clostridia bacterium]
MQITKAVILAAGLGTRFLPYTKAYPKEMIAVVDKPALQLIVEEVVDSGINDILIIINHSKEEIIKHFSTDLELEKFLLDKGKTKELAIVRAISTLAHITYAYQEIPNGTGGAIALAESFANKEPILVLNGDDAMYNFDTPVSRQIMDAYAHCN